MDKKPGIETLLNIHSILWDSRANGPGKRIAVWFQGCSIRCEGCFNPLTHPATPNQLIAPSALAERIVTKSAGIEGITISGGEPFDQPEGLLELLKSIKETSPLTVILFSGYTFQAIGSMPLGESILKQTDVLIAGPFDKNLLKAQNLAGSSNKTYHFITERYSLTDLDDVPDIEAIIDENGNITWSGIGRV